MKIAPFIAHSELTNEIYIVAGDKKYRVTEQTIKAVKAIKALEQEPSNKNNLGVDYVARQDVERYIEGFVNEYTSTKELEFINLELDGLKHLPSVTPIRPKGHWINKQRLFDSCSAECSSCHKRSNGYMHDNGFSLESNYNDFCPNCGAKMESEVEE